MQLADFYTQHPRLTKSLRKFVEEYQEQMDAVTYAEFLQHLSDEITAHSLNFQALTSNEERARMLHKLVDQEILSGANVPCSCKKGCSACCHMEVEITSYEADILKDLVLAGHKIDADRLLRQSQRELQDPLWKQGARNLEGQCVFLDQEGSCSIYEHRPIMCRRHSVSSPAKNCFTLDAPITVRYFPRVDLLISAANEDAGVRIGPMAKMLVRALNEENKGK
jgi:Fe-S-cluster containining protein